MKGRMKLLSTRGSGTERMEGRVQILMEEGGDHLSQVENRLVKR